MRKKPSGSELLQIALEVVRKEFIEETSNEKRYSALMVSNAVAIVARQIQSAPDSELRERDALSVILENTADIRTLNQLLSNKIRNGDYTAGSVKAKKVWNALFKITKANVLESNPKYLK